MQSVHPHRLTTFTHLDVDLTTVYRLVLGAFATARESFALHLRPSEILIRLREQGSFDLDEEVLDRALAKLVEWGNIERHADMSEVATVEEFKRPRYVYQLTKEGEATEIALGAYFEAVSKEAELQAAALTDIKELLRELLAYTQCSEEPEAARILRTFTALRGRFDDLTTRAQAFIGLVQRPSDLHGVGVQPFLAYKDALIGYLERFIHELVVSSGEIRTLIREVEHGGVEPLVFLAAQREVVDQLKSSGAEEVEGRWRTRWLGLKSWFVGKDGSPSQSEILRATARSAIPTLIQKINSLNELRMARTDRSADLRTLARWFAEAADDAYAHRLFRAAFALSPARHLSIDHKTLDQAEDEPVSPRTSWLNAPPLVISPRLRRYGSHSKRGRAPAVPDLTEAKARLRQQAAEEVAQTQRAMESLTRMGRCRLSALSELDSDEFHLLLDLLGEALASRADAQTPAVATSTDGSLEIILTPIAGASEAVIKTSDGTFSGPDHEIEIMSTITRRTLPGSQRATATNVTPPSEIELAATSV